MSLRTLFPGARLGTCLRHALLKLPKKHGASFFLELPHLNSRTFQVWLEGFAAGFPDSFNMLVLDNGALHKAKALRWPANVVPVFFPAYSPERNSIERLWRDLKDKLADRMLKTLDELSNAMCTIIQTYTPAMLQSLTGFAYFVQAIDTARRSLYV